jgi:hypothetical protein
MRRPKRSIIEIEGLEVAHGIYLINKAAPSSDLHLTVRSFIAKAALQH